MYAFYKLYVSKLQCETVQTQVMVISTSWLSYKGGVNLQEIIILILVVMNADYASFEVIP